MPQLLKHLPLLAFVWLTSLSAGASVGVKSYREWKTERVSQASGRVASVKNQLDIKKTASVDPNLAMNRSKHQLEGTPGISIKRNIPARIPVNQIRLIIIFALNLINT
jgi:hypothetical protein